jgi:dephospho-CoA kinase
MTTARRVVLAVCGAKRAGKDALCDVLTEEYGAKRMKFARYLKDMVRAAFGLTEDEVEGDKKDYVVPRLGVTPRTIMQFLGTEVMQFEIQKIMPAVGRNIWADRLVRDINEHFSEQTPMATINNNNNNIVVVSDLRFLHEYHAITRASDNNSWKLVVAKVVRKNYNNNNDKQQLKHTSEQEWDLIPADVVVQNDGTLNELKNAARNIANNIIGI